MKEWATGERRVQSEVGDKKERECEDKIRREKNKNVIREIWTFHLLPILRSCFAKCFFQNSSSSIREAVPLEEPKPELFLKEPEPYQIDPRN